MADAPTPNPGSDEALELGCRCPVLDNAHGRGAMGTSGDDAEFWTNAACPLHGATISDPKDTPITSLADRMTRIITAGDGHRSIVFQSSVSDSDRRAAAARLRKLDRIAVRYPSWASDLSITETLLRRLADALEADDG